jgi:hypothetical protein
MVARSTADAIGETGPTRSLPEFAHEAEHRRWRWAQTLGTIFIRLLYVIANVGVEYRYHAIVSAQRPTRIGL